MNIDFHTHVKLAKNLPFSDSYTKVLFREVKTSGLDALCLTEHFNTVGFNEIYKYISKEYTKDGDSFQAEGLRLFPGMEVDISEGGHILMIGSLEHILDLNEKLEPFKEKDKFLSLEKLLIAAQSYKMIIGAAHPFRSGSNIPLLDTGLLSMMTFIDLNGKDCAQKGIETQIEIYEFGNKLNLPVVAGSDTHQHFQYGCIWNDFNHDCSTIQDLIDTINKKEYKINISKDIELKVKSATVLKKALKKVNSFGGDYVSVLIEDE